MRADLNATPTPTDNNDSGLEDRRGMRSESANNVSWFGHFAWYAARILLALFVVIGVTAWYVYNSAQRAPDFYANMISISPSELENEGREFEARIFDLQNSTQEQGEWEATFTDKQLNGWLGSDLPEKFPDAIPNAIEDPRIAIEEDTIKIAFRVNSRRLRGYVVAIGDAFCSGEKNQVAIRIKSAKAGIAPIPIGVWANSVTAALRRLGTETTWTEIDGDPVALITLPGNLTDSDDRRIELTSVRLLDGKMVLSGVTIAFDSK